MMDSEGIFKGDFVLYDVCFIIDFRMEPFPLPRCDSTQLCSDVDDTFKGISVNGAHPEVDA